ncbi:MAG: uncharacterized protein PWQ50_2058, partial [Methanolobus sp.]|nr:uncharacterized protein [Methanolobus sp.]
DAALLIACDYELNKVMMGLKGKRLITYGVPMLNDGCFNTEVEYEKVIETWQNDALKRAALTAFGYAYINFGNGLNNH